MFKRMYKTVLKASVLSMSIFTLGAAYADQTDTLVNNGLNRLKAGAASQARIDQLADDTDKVIRNFHQERKQVEGLKVHNDRLRKTLTAQEETMVKLRRSIENASQIERQIVPLMMRMIAGLEKFIESDLPFKLDERRDRVSRIKSYLTNANISAAERFRKVLEAYSIENSYGQAIDVYLETLNVNNEDLTVNLLQLGRTNIYFQTTDGTNSGYFNKKTEKWEILDSSYNEGIARAIKVAQKKVSPELMLLPIQAPEGL